MYEEHGEKDCEEIQFMFGRKDCVSEYEGEFEQFKTDRHERHPNPGGNGDATLKFFKNEFGLSGPCELFIYSFNL